MSKNIAIIGAGQAGLQLALGLLSNNYKVTLISQFSAQEILNGKILSSQGMFNEALQCERELGIDFWLNDAPQNTSVTLTVAKPESSEIGIRWSGLVNKPYQSVDQRLKFSFWLDEVSKRGGEVITQHVTLDSLDKIAKSHDLTIVASGKGELSKLFKRDEQRSVHLKPPRALACIYVRGMTPISLNHGVRFNLIPGIGEYFTMPGITINGSCEMMLFEGIPGGAFDCWSDLPSSKQRLEKAISLLKQFVPWEAERCVDVELTDDNATLTGSYIPEVRYPIHTMPSGQAVLGMGDAVVLNDPIAGQGANNASKCAKIYLDKIIANQDKPFNQEWMQYTFDSFWENAQWSTALSNLLLLPPEPHVIELLIAAQQSPKIASRIANGFDCPRTLFPWITSASATKIWMQSITEDKSLGD